MNGNNMDVIYKYRKDISEAICNDDSDSLIVQNLPLVIFLAKRFLKRFPRLEIDDLIGWGNIGLCKAAKNFDLSRKLKFSTYAATVIYREFLKYMVDSQNRGRHLPKNHTTKCE